MKIRDLKNNGFIKNYAQLLPEEIDEIKCRILDAIIAMIGGILSIDHEEMEKYLALADGKETSRPIFPLNFKTSPEMAAFINGIFIRYSDWGDTYRRDDGIGGHPSDQVAGMLAMCDDESLDGRRIIEALYTAYQLYSVLQEKMFVKNPGLDYTSSLSLTIPLIYAILHNMDEDESQNILNLSACGGVVLAQVRPADITNLKSAATGYAMARALWCTRLGRAICAPGSMFDGRFGWYKVVAPLSGEDIAANNWERAFAASEIKTFPCFHVGQAATECGVELHKKLNATTENVIGIEIRVSKSDADYIIRPGQSRYPTTQAEADHNLSYCMVTAMRNGVLTPKQYDNNELSNEETKRLMDLITIGFLSEDELIGMCAEKGACSVSVKTASGETFSYTVACPEGSIRYLPTVDRIEHTKSILQKKKQMLEAMYALNLTGLFDAVFSLESLSGKDLIDSIHECINVSQNTP